jgi:hypothetical protein
MGYSTGEEENLKKNYSNKYQRICTVDEDIEAQSRYL